MLRIARETGGVVASATEEELVEGIELLAASEGIFAETAGGVTVAVLASWRAPAAGRAARRSSPTSRGRVEDRRLRRLQGAGTRARGCIAAGGSGALRGLI